MRFVTSLLALASVGCSVVYGSQLDTLPPLEDARAPKNFAELWAGFDPRAEPLEVEVLRQWEEEEVLFRIVRFRIGVFRGEKARLAAIYGFPKDVSESGMKLPALLQIHGGGQYADHRACLMNAKRGYATISIAWAGRISAPGYRVTPEEVELFWNGKTNDPKYKLTTDWGVLDGYHAPGRNPGNQFPSVKPAAWTLDEVESPRNSGWFLCALAARRALTFLERQPEVDPNRLGVYGHSMGGKLTVMTAVDSRVKAAAPSCGGISDRDNDSPLFRGTLGDNVSLKNVSCPIVFLSPSNDFHGRIDDLQKAVQEISSEEWRVTCSAHHNHQDTAEYQVVGPLWFDQYLKGAFCYPKTPATSLELKTQGGYTQQGQPEGEKNDRENTMNRFWHHASPARCANTWTAKLPLLSTDRPLWVYANVSYPLDTTVTSAGYYYGPYTATMFNLSSTMHVATQGQLEEAEVKATLKPSLVIESFEGDWEKEWFTYKPEDWARRTHKIYDDRWQAPSQAKLAFEVRAAKPNKMVVGLDQFATEVVLIGNRQWQSVTLTPTQFHDAEGDSLPGWEDVKELRIAAMETLRATGKGPSKSRVVGESWQGPKPDVRNLRWECGELGQDWNP
jgi:hypothetical protein